MPGWQKLRKTIPCKFCPEQIIPMGARGFENIDGIRHECKALQKSYSIHPNNPSDSIVQTNIDDKIPGLELEISKLQKEMFEVKDELNCLLALVDFNNKRKADKISTFPANPKISKLEMDGIFND